MITDDHGQHKKIIKLSDIELQENILDALIRCHAFTGNDFVS